MSGFGLRVGLPGIGNDWCSKCREYTIHRLGVCMRTGCGEALPTAVYRRPRPMRRARRAKATGLIRRTDPVTGLERSNGGAHLLKVSNSL